MKQSAGSETVLKVSHLSKSYHVKGSQDVQALKDVSFELNKGEILGVIGRNGAGKSTLLKILGDVIAPTSGEIQYEGNIVSILDIGSGFHPDLSGYENIFLNASILGMSRNEIRNKVDQIIDFSGIAEFIHHPIKTYSNGMYLRLAFSVAIHVDPQILLLDEVIAVGDNEFQDKCNSKLHELAAKGLTIILITHNTAQVLEFCTRCIWLEKGAMQFDGPAIDAVERYIGDALVEQEPMGPNGQIFLKKIMNLEIPGVAIFRELSIFSGNEAELWPLYTGDPVIFKFLLEKLTDDSTVELAIHITNLDGVRIFLDSHALRPADKLGLITGKGHYEIECHLPERLLTRGVYRLSVMISKSFELEAHLENIVSFKVLPSNSESGLDNHFNKMNTVIAPWLDWQIKKQ